MANNNCYKVINCRRKHYRKMWANVSPPEGHIGPTFFVEVKPDQFSIGTHVKQRIERARSALEIYDQNHALPEARRDTTEFCEAPTKRFLLKIPAEKFFDALRDAGFDGVDNIIDPNDLETVRLKKQTVH